MCGENDTLWVLDLEDSHGFAIAVACESDQTQAVARITDARDSILSTNCLPAQTMLTPAPLTNALIAHGWKMPPLPERGRYLAVVSDGRCLVAKLPCPDSATGNPTSLPTGAPLKRPK